MSNCFIVIFCFYIYFYGCWVGLKVIFIDEEEFIVWEVESYFEKCLFVFCLIIDVVVKFGWFLEVCNFCGF